MTAVDDPLRPTLCPRCEYPLVGLPAAGVCPECGRAYGGPEVVLYAQDSPPEPFGPGQFVGWASGWLLASAVGLFVTITSPGYPRFELHPFWAAGFGSAVVAAVWSIRRSRRHRRVLLRFTPAGVRQGRRGWGPVPFGRGADRRVFPWCWVRSVEFTALPDDRLRVVVAVPRQRWLPQCNAVNAVVGCRQSDVSPLRDRVRSWWAAATGADAG